MSRQVIYASPDAVRFMLPVIRPISATVVEDADAPPSLTFDSEMCSIYLSQPATVHVCPHHDVVIYRHARQGGVWLNCPCK